MAAKRVKKLVYWVCPIADDRATYNIRARTRREAEQIRQADGADRFGKPVKVEVPYRDAFDLMMSLLGEGASEPWYDGPSKKRDDRD